MQPALAGEVEISAYDPRFEAPLQSFCISVRVRVVNPFVSNCESSFGVILLEQAFSHFQGTLLEISRTLPHTPFAIRFSREDKQRSKFGVICATMPVS